MSSASSIDPKLVQLARNEVRAVVHEITQLARGDLAPRDFYREFLGRMVEGLAASGGCIWTIGEAGARVEAQQTYAELGTLADQASQHRHAALLERVRALKSAVAVPPDGRLTSPEEEHGSLPFEPHNPGPHLLLFAPLVVQDRVVAIIEIVQRARASPVTQRGYLRFLEQMGEIACGWLQKQTLRAYGSREELWSQWHSFAQLVHASLDVRAVSLAIVGESRRLLGCDRVTLVVARGGRWKAEAISGLEVVDDRSAVVKSLVRMAQAVAVAGEPLWHSTGSSLQDLAPTVERALQGFLEQTPTRMTGVVPLLVPKEPGSRPGRARPLAALVIEQIESTADRDRLAEHARLVAGHAATSLNNALAHESMPLSWLARWLTNLSWLVAWRQLPKTLAVAIGALLAALALVVVPADLEIEAPGRLIPVMRREVFAAVDGDIVRVHVRHGQRVAQGETLIELRNVELEMRGASISGERLKAREHLHAVEQALLGERRVPEADRVRLHDERLQLEKQLDGLEKQWSLHKKQLEALKITSPIQGQVVTWAVDDLLLHRPVHRGDALLSVIDPENEWELELRVPEDHMGHLDAARNQTAEALRVTYVMATDPGTKHSGSIRELETQAEVRGDDGNTVLAKVPVVKGDIPDPRYGAEVTGKVDCGSHSLGYVLFHGVIAFVQKRLLFWI